MREVVDVIEVVDVTDAADVTGGGMAVEIVDVRDSVIAEASISETAEDGAEADFTPQPPAQEQHRLDLGELPSGARGAVEAVLMVVDEPVTEVVLASALGLHVEEIHSLLVELAEDYTSNGRGFELREVAGGWRVYSRAEYASVIERFMLDGQAARLTQAALETLAIVAYRQPVSRARVGAIRGVNVDAVMRTLLTRGLVEERGQDPETSAVLYGTTTYFLQRMGLTSLDQLPALAPFLPEVEALEEIGIGGGL